MAYFPRCFESDQIYFVTSRTIDRTLFLAPSPEVTNAIGAVLADAQTRHQVELFEFVLLSNHMHLAVRGKAETLPAFMQYLKSNIAVAVNAILGRHGQLWDRRYMASPILDEGAQIDRALYFYGHGVKEGLVDHVEQWPGVASVKERLTGQRPTYQRLNRTALSRAQFNRKQLLDPTRFKRPVEVKLSPWPFLQGLSKEAAQLRVAELVAKARQLALEDRDGALPLGVARVLAQDPFSRPKGELRRTPNPLCHTSELDRRISYCKEFAEFCARYRAASRRFRGGDLATNFPAHSFRPPLPFDWDRRLRAGPATVAV